MVALLLTGLLLVAVVPMGPAGSAAVVRATTTSASGGAPGVGRARPLSLHRPASARSSTHASTRLQPASVGENPPGRVTQVEGTGGYTFTGSDAESLATTVTVPSMNCSTLGQPPGPSWSSGIDKSYAVPFLQNGPVDIQLFYQCLTSTTGHYDIVSTLDPGCVDSHGFGISCPLEAPNGGGISPGDQVELTLTTSTSASSVTLDDTTSGATENWTGPGLTTSGPIAAVGVEDYCTIPGGGPNPGSEPCSEDSPSAPAPPADYFPYGPFTFSGTTVGGSALGTVLAGSSLGFWTQDNSVYGSTLLDQTSWVAAGSSFTVTYADTVLPALQISTPDPIDQPASGTAVLDFTVSLSFPSSEPVYVDYATSDGTAVSGQDYQGTSGTLLIPAGTRSETIPVTVLGAAERGGKAQFNLSLSNPSYAVGNPSSIGTIIEGPIVTAVNPPAVPLDGLTPVTVSGLHFGGAGSPDSVTFCDESIYGSPVCAAGTDVQVVSDTELTVVTPNGVPLQPLGYAQFDVDTIVTDAAGISSPISEPADVVQFGCEQLTAPDGDYTFSGCVTPEGSTDVSEQGSVIDGMDVTGASPSDPVDYAVGSTSVASAGTVGVSLNLGGKLITILQGQLAKQLATPITFTVPAGTQIAGFTISGTLTLTPDGSQAATGSVTVTLPGILGGGTGTLTFVTALGKGLSNVSITVPSANFMQLFSLTDVSASYDIANGTWSLAATASTGPSQQTTFSGSLTYSGNTLTAGSLAVNQISLAGLLDLSGLSVTYSSTKGWNGTATITQSTQAGTESGTVALTVSNAGVLTSGSLKVKNVPLYGVITLKTFDMTYSSGEWKLAVTSSVPGTGKGSGSASMTVSNGIITAAQLSLSDVSVLSKVTVKTATLTYTTGGGNETWAGSWDVDLPQAAASAVDNINGSLTFTNGSFVSGSIGIGANVPLIDGVYLTHLGASLALATATAPMAIGGSATISLGPVVHGSTLASLAGGILRAFPLGSKAGSYTFNGNLAILGTTVANGSVVVPDSGATTMTLSAGPQNGSGLSIPVTVGSVNVGTVSVVGGLTGSFSASSFTLSGAVTISIPGISTPFQANLVANSTGMAACAGPSGSQYGFEYDWGGDPTYQDSTGCSELGF